LSKIHSLKVEKRIGHEELKRMIRKKEKDVKVLNVSQFGHFGGVILLRRPLDVYLKSLL